MPDRILRDWTDSETVNSLSWQAECFFVRLIMKADDFGRYHGNQKLLKSLLFPLKDGLRDADITRWIAECVNAGMIVVYTDKVSGKPFLRLVNFGQRLRTRKAKFPDENGSYSAEDYGECRQSADNCQQVAADCGNMRLEVEVEEKRRRSEEEVEVNNIAPTRVSTFSRYPETVDEVLAIASSPQCGVNMSRKAAENYLQKRAAVDWVDGCGRKIKRVALDIKNWQLREEQNKADAKRKEPLPVDDDDEAFAENYNGDI